MPFGLRQKQPCSSGRGKLVLGTASLYGSGFRGARFKEPLTVGGIACLAKAALEKNVGRTSLKNLRKVVGGLPAHTQKLVAKAFAGKVRGRLVAAAWAGAVSKTATAPLETVRMQMMTGTKGSLREVVKTTWVNGGLLGFFSGNEADVLRTMPSKAIELASFDLYKKLLSVNGEGKAPGGLVTSLAGAMAGITSTVAMFPLETARTRLAVNSRQYKNMFHCLSSVAKQEGLGAWYKGLDASLIGVIPYAAVRLGMYDGLKKLHTRVTGSDQIPAQNSMLYGALAAVTSATVSFPLEVVRRRMMLGTAKGNTLVAIMQIAQTEGVRSLYKGVLLTWIKQAPQYAVTFCCYDLAKAWLADNAPKASEMEDAPKASESEDAPPPRAPVTA